MRSLPAALAAPAAAATLSWLAPVAGVLTAVRADAHPGGDPEAAVVHLVALTAWVLVGWLLLATATTLTARLPGAVGRTAEAMSRHVAPTLIRRAICGSAALGIAVAPALAPTAALAARCAPGRLPTLDRTATACAPTASPAPLPSGSAPPSHLAGTTAAPAAVPAPPAVARAHTVIAGDTLWGLATTELTAAGLPTTPARVADRWPAWWQTNRAEIGDDPNLIHVGTLLSAPDPLEKTR